MVLDSLSLRVSGKDQTFYLHRSDHDGHLFITADRLTIGNLVTRDGCRGPSDMSDDDQVSLLLGRIIRAVKEKKKTDVSF